MLQLVCDRLAGVTRCLEWSKQGDSLGACRIASQRGHEPTRTMTEDERASKGRQRPCRDGLVVIGNVVAAVPAVAQIREALRRAKSR